MIWGEMSQWTCCRHVNQTTHRAIDSSIVRVYFHPRRASFIVSFHYRLLSHNQIWLGAWKSLEFVFVQHAGTTTTTRMTAPARESSDLCCWQNHHHNQMIMRLLSGDGISGLLCLIMTDSREKLRINKRMMMMVPQKKQQRRMVWGGWKPGSCAVWLKWGISAASAQQLQG